ncbi:hypothetical protein L7F22_034415 [Adiantum nelumboides]|nr:hypothetical protein [Adiantum nelumboides]
MSRFIHLLSQIISPLQKLANQEVFTWEQEHLECFNEVKEVLGFLSTIMPLDPQGTYYLCPSVGLDAFGAVLMQKDPKTAYMRPIYFTSKVMTQGQKGYTDIEQLVFSLIVAMRKFRSYLLPKPFIILTLEHNLPYAIHHMSISSKISKWVLELQEYEYTFIVEDSTRASLADVLTYKVKEEKITPKAQGKLDFSPQGELENAYTLLFDGAYRRQRNKAAGGFVILNEEKKEVLKKGIQLHLAHSNNEAEYATLKAGLEECKSMGIRRLMVKGDALLIVRQVQGTWACKNSKVLQWLHEVKLLMKEFEAIQIQHISRQHNKEADNMANTQFEVMVGAIKFKEPLFQGQETMEDILYFLETDSGATRHMTSHKDWYASLRPVGDDIVVAVGNNAKCPAKGSGTISFMTDMGVTKSLPDVLYVPEMKRNLLSVAAITDHDLKVQFDKIGAQIINSDGVVVGKATRSQFHCNSNISTLEYSSLMVVHHP